MAELKKGDKVVPVDPYVFNKFYFWPDLPEFFVIDRLPDPAGNGNSCRLIDPRHKEHPHWAHISLIKLKV
jgi:hypothetical protein